MCLRSELQPVRLLRHRAEPEPHDPPPHPDGDDACVQGKDATLTPDQPVLLSVNDLRSQSAAGRPRSAEPPAETMLSQTYLYFTARR